LFLLLLLLLFVEIDSFPEHVFFFFLGHIVDSRGKDLEYKDTSQRQIGETKTLLTRISGFVVRPPLKPEILSLRSSLLPMPCPAENTSTHFDPLQNASIPLPNHPPFPGKSIYKAFFHFAGENPEKRGEEEEERRKEKKRKKREKKKTNR
jgi:hypothetical protein